MTTQIGDRLLWRGVEHTIESGSPLLDAWPEDKRPTFRSFSSACWRGFIATWVVDDENWLRVASVRTGSLMQRLPGGGITLTKGSEEALHKLFPGHDGPVTASWFSGELLTGYGESESLIGLYTVVYAYYRIFHVDRGRVVQIDDRDRNWWYERHPDMHPDHLRALWDRQQDKEN